MLAALPRCSRPQGESHSRCVDAQMAHSLKTVTALYHFLTLVVPIGTKASLPGGSNLIPLQMFFQADEALVADDDVVDQLDVEDAAGLHELQGRLNVLR